MTPSQPIEGVFREVRRSVITATHGDQIPFPIKKPAGMERETYRWRVETDGSGQKVCLQNAKINGCAYRR